MPSPRLGRRPSFAFLFAAVGILAVAAHLVLVWSAVMQEASDVPPLHYDVVYGMGRAADFNAVYHAALNIERGLSPYRKAPDGITPYFQAFRYLPVVAYAARVFLPLGPHFAYLAWVIVTETMLVLTVLALRRRVGQRSLLMAALVLLAVNSPYALELYMGQFTFAAVALACLALLGIGGPGVYTAAVLLKVFPVAMVPAFIRARPYWRHLAVALLFLLLSSLPYFLGHPQTGTSSGGETSRAVRDSTAAIMG